MKKLNYFVMTFALLMLGVSGMKGQGSGDVKTITSTFTEVSDYVRGESYCYGNIQTQEGRQWHFFGPGNPDWPSFKKTTVGGTGCLEVTLRRYWSWGMTMNEPLCGRIKSVHVLAGGNLGQIQFSFGEYSIERDYNVSSSSWLNGYTFDFSDDNIMLYDEPLTVWFALEAEEYYNPFYVASVTVEYWDLDRIEWDITNSFCAYEPSGSSGDLEQGTLKTREGNDWNMTMGIPGASVEVIHDVLNINGMEEEVLVYVSHDENPLVISAHNAATLFHGNVKKLLVKAGGVLGKIEARIRDRVNGNNEQRVTCYPSGGGELQDIEIPMNPDLEYEDGVIEITLYGEGLLFLHGVTIVQDVVNKPVLRGECGEHVFFTIWQLPYTSEVWDSSISDFKQERALKLVISGTGKMDDINSWYPKPWEADGMENICEVVLEEGVENLGESALSQMDYVTKVTLPKSLKMIGAFAMQRTAIKAINIPDGVESIGECAFLNCRSLRTVRIGRGVKSIGERVFLQSTDIDNVYAYCNPNNLTWAAYPVNEPESFKPNKTTRFHVVPGTKDTWESKFGFLNVTFVDDLGDVMPSITEKKTVSPMDLASTDLTDNIIDDIYYNLDPNTGSGYRTGYLQIGTTTDISTIGSGIPGSIEVRNNFTGIILMVGPGSGLISLNVAGTSGMKLAVTIDGKTTTYDLTNKPEEVHISYNLNAMKYVYIYAVDANGLARAFGHNAATANGDCVMIYGINVEPEANAITDLKSEGNQSGTVKGMYDLSGRIQGTTPKGLMIIDGQKVLVK